MFTGLIEEVQPIQSNTATKDGRRLGILLGRCAEGMELADSLCVNGVCLTLSSLSSGTGFFDVMAETLRVSTLGDLKPGLPVNLERAMAANARFGGHIVQGHVDGVGRIKRIEQAAGQYTLWIEADKELTAMMIPKGSVAVDGVGLTVVQTTDRQFSVGLIPTTLQKTTLGRLKPQDKVNLEADIISKWVARRLDQILQGLSKTGEVTPQLLREQGFI